MKKWVIFLSMSVLLAACSNNQEKVNDGANSPPDEEVVEKDGTGNGSIGTGTVADDIDLADFFLDDGAIAHFKGDGIEFSTYTTRTEWLDDRHVNVYEDNGGVEIVKSYRLEDDKIVVLQEEPIGTEGYTTTVEQLETMEPLKTYLAFPLEVGMKIDVWTVVSLDEEVETPLQKFSDVIVLEETFDEGEAVNRSYFAKGFGEIKREYIAQEEDGTFEVTSVIESIE